MKRFECVDKGQYEIDSRHADFRTIEAENANIAKSKYCKLSPDTKYVHVLCKTEKGYPQW